MSNDNGKKAAGYAAADLIKEGMVVGLGTGSTAKYFIERLGQKCREGLKIQAVATSKKSQAQALELGIELADIQEITSIDMTVDGADEIDEKKRMIKGGGGALLREKIVASMSKEMVVIVDSSKVVKHLGSFPLPVEIVPFAFKSILNKIEKMGYRGTVRTTPDKKIFMTDNQNLIYDVHLSNPCLQPEKDEERLRSVVGVVETGFFFNLAGRVIIGFDDGKVKIQ